MTSRLLEDLAFMLPGQGSQSVGMGRKLANRYPVAQQTFEDADAALGFKLCHLCWEGPEDKLRLTEITQPAILTVSVAAFRVLREHGIVPTIVAVHSLGEYSAHVAAGTLEFGDAVRAVHLRGRYMQEAVPVGEGAMAAVLGMPINQLQQICDESAQDGVCQPANINSPDQIVISGSKSAVERAAELAKQRGARKAIMLPVSAPFHSALMKPAQDRLAPDLQALKLRKMSVPVVTNVDAEVVSDPEKARDALIRQVCGAVQWERSMRVLIERGISRFIEVGPGKVLCGLMRQIDRSKTCLNVEDETSLQKVA